jgi:hypothetical protein
MLCADAQQLPHDDNIYRVYICPNTNTIAVACIGMDSVDSGAEGDYHSVDALPLWMQEKIALLMMTALDKPTKSVEGVGRRIDANTYWVYRV